MCSIESNPFIDRLEAFQEMTHSPSVTANCQDIIDTIKADIALYEAALAHFKSAGYGLTLANTVGDMWTIVLEDMSEPGRFRHQTFTTRGFFGHYTMDSIEEVIEDAIDQGFRHLDNGRLEQLCVTNEWSEGSRMGALIQALNNGQITWHEFTNQTSLQA
jgi:hypothetical protein